MPGKPSLIILPQRLADGAGYVSCQPHAAHRFAVCELVTWKVRGRKMSRTRVKASYATMAEAVADLNGRLRSAPAKKLSLNQRWNRTADSPAPLIRGIGRGPVSLFKGTVSDD